MCNDKKYQKKFKYNFDTFASSGYIELQKLTKKLVKQLRGIDRWIVDKIGYYNDYGSLHMLYGLVESLILVIGAICNKQEKFCSPVREPSEKANQDICRDMKSVFEVRLKKILEKHILEKPYLIDFIDRQFNPILGKSLSIYFEKK